MARSRAHGAPRAAPTPAAAGTRHAAAEPTMGYSASNAVRGEAHRPGQAAAPDRRPRTADQAPEEEVLRPAALHRQVHHRAIHQLERAQSQTGSELDRPARPPLLLLLLLAAQNAPCSAAGAGPICAVLSVCAGGPALYIVAPPNARAGAWPVGARKCTDLIYWILCRPWSCLASADRECTRPAAAPSETPYGQRCHGD